MKMKDDRFAIISAPSENNDAEKKKESWLLQAKNKISKFKQNVEDLAIKNSEKYRRPPFLSACSYCGRQKMFPCQDPKHMQILEGLCPDKVCAQVLEELGETPDVDMYPEYRS
jgi:hypothetical protein